MFLFGSPENVFRGSKKEHWEEKGYPRDIEILGWCPAGPLTHGEKVPL